MNNFISSFCSIRDHQIAKDGQILFRGTNESVQQFLEDAYRHFGLNYSKFYKMDKLSQLGWLASELIFSDGSLIHGHSPDQIAVVLANRNASLDTDLAFQESIHKIPSPSLFVYTLPNIVAGEICIRNGLKGENAFFVQDAFDPGFLSSYVDDVLLGKNSTGCLAGWVDVIGEDYEVFLYFAEKIAGDGALAHSESELIKLYSTHG